MFSEYVLTLSSDAILAITSSGAFGVLLGVIFYILEGDGVYVMPL